MGGRQAKVDIPVSTCCLKCHAYVDNPKPVTTTADNNNSSVCRTQNLIPLKPNYQHQHEARVTEQRAVGLRGRSPETYQSYHHNNHSSSKEANKEAKGQAGVNTRRSIEILPSRQPSRATTEEEVSAAKRAQQESTYSKSGSRKELQFLRPQRSELEEQEERGEYRSNRLEETLCTMRLRENIAARSATTQGGRTNDQAMVSPVATKTLMMRAMPEEVLMSAYQLSSDEARKLKFKQLAKRKSMETNRRQIDNSKDIREIMVYVQDSSGNATYMQDVDSFQIKSLKTEHKCIRNFKIKLANSKWLAKQYENKIIDNPKWKLKDFKTDVLEKYAVDAPLIQCYRAKKITLGEAELSLIDHNGKVWDCTCEVLRSTPGN
ncbi:hypothetical protein LguiA_016618 [Lonicera macranthoides]